MPLDSTPDYAWHEESEATTAGEGTGTEARPSNEPRPYWIPPDLDLASLPRAFQLSISEILNPAYQELVLEAQDALERATGVSFVHLLWLELLDQFALAKDVSSTLKSTTSISDDRLRSIDRLLRLVGAKQKAASFLVRLKNMRQSGDLGSLSLTSQGERDFGKM